MKPITEINKLIAHCRNSKRVINYADNANNALKLVKREDSFYAVKSPGDNFTLRFICINGKIDRGNTYPTFAYALCIGWLISRGISLD